MSINAAVLRTGGDEGNPESGVPPQHGKTTGQQALPAPDVERTFDIGRQSVEQSSVVVHGAAHATAGEVALPVGQQGRRLLESRVCSHAPASFPASTIAPCTG